MQPTAHWLNALGLGQSAQRFADNHIDAGILRDLTDEDLERIGVSLGHRKKILRAIAELDEVGITPASPRWDEAERRQLTVMLADLVGSTALSTRLDPEDLRKIIGAYQRRCAEVIAKSAGFVASYMGDGILSYFGYPQAHEEDAERAVRAGLELIEAAAKLDDGAGAALHMRVAIATGLVVVGDLRSEGVVQEHDGRPLPDLAGWGYCVNLVSSLAGIVVPGQGAGDRSPGFDGQMDQGPERGNFGALRGQWR